MSRLLSTDNLTVLGILSGIAFGIFFPAVALEQKVLGDIFLALLKMLIMPLVFASVFVAVVGLGSVERLKRMGLRVIGFYLLTTSLAVLMGILMMNLINPGYGMQAHVAAVHTNEISPSDLILSIFPINIFESLASGKALQVIFFSILLAVATLHLSAEKRGTVQSFFDALNDAMILIASWVVTLTPLGVFSIISYVIAKEGMASLYTLWQYALTVIAALMLHALVTLPAVGFLIGGYNPYRYLAQVKEAVLLAFSTASSAASIPVSIDRAERHGGVSKKTAGFVIPLGATINMDGTALYEAIAVMFIANLAGVELCVSEQLLIFITATFTSIGVAGVPGASIVMLTMILSIVGLPVEYIGMILVIDRILDMFRTSVNVWGDLVGAKTIDRFIDVD